MNLLLIILVFVLISFIIKFFPKSFNIIILLTCCCVIFSYFELTKSFPEHSFLPQKYQYEQDCRYNRLVHSLRNHRLDFEETIPDILNDKNIYKMFPSYLASNPILFDFYDLSVYNGKVYIYWGLTPLLLFYLPFNLITNLYLSDNSVVFILLSLLFLLSLLILKKFFNTLFPEKDYKEKILFYLSTLITGFGNYSVFIAIRPSICEVAVACAAVLLLLAVYLFIKYITEQKYKNIIIFFTGLLLSLSVGCRPHYILFIPLFYIFIIYIQYTKGDKIKDIFKTSLVFLLPYIIYGTVLALYNYCRFDSVFEFGWKYQLNHMLQYYYTPTLKDFVTGFKHHLFQFPLISKENYTVFSLVKVTGHRIGNELITGLIYFYPLSVFLILSPVLFFIRCNKKVLISLLISLLISIFLINFVTACFFGMIQRYVFEYTYILTIITLMILFICYYNASKDMKNIIFISFVFLVIFTLYINISLLLSFNHVIMFARTESLSFYEKLINFLFNAKLSFGLTV